MIAPSNPSSVTNVASGFILPRCLPSTPKGIVRLKLRLLRLSVQRILLSVNGAAAKLNT